MKSSEDDREFKISDDDNSAGSEDETGYNLPGNRSSHLQIFFNICFLKIFAIFTGKHLCWSLF